MVTSVRVAARERRALAMPASEHLPPASVVVALARVETKKILLHPVFLGTMAVLGLFVVRGVVGSGGSNVNNGLALGIGLAIGLVAGSFLSVNIATQRARRDRVQELFASLPAPAESRTLAVLLGALFGPVTLSILVAGIGGAWLDANPRFAPDVDLALMVQLPLTLAVLAALGVALGRWIPSLVTAPVVLIAHVTTGIIWVLPWIINTSSGIRIGWHLTYLASMVVLWSAAALGRDRRTPVRLVVAGIALAITVAAASVQIPPGGLH